MLEVSGRASLCENQPMYDKKIQEVKTGMDKLYKVLIILLAVAVLGRISYYFIIKKNKLSITQKIRKRRIHK